MYVEDGQKLMNWTIAATVAMCAGFEMIFIQEWLYAVGDFLLFVVLMRQAEKVRREIDWEGEWPDSAEHYGVDPDAVDKAVKGLIEEVERTRND